MSTISMEPYYLFFSAALQKGLLPIDEIKNKNILIVGRYTVEGLQQRIEVDVKGLLMREGAASCIGYGMFNGVGADFTGDIADMLSVIENDTFDCVILLEGLEKEKRLGEAISAIKCVCKSSGKIIVCARTPVIQDTSVKVNYYEDVWRFDLDSLRDLFSDCNFEVSVEVDGNTFIAAKFKKPFDFLEESCALKSIYSFRLKEKVVMKAALETGYFVDYRYLAEIGDRLRTDKSAHDHNYLDKYEFFLAKFRNKKIKLMELGIFDGASLYMWRDYFPLAEIVGVDIDASCKRCESGKIKCIIGDLSRNELLSQLKNERPDIVVDDASHLWSHQIKALFALFSELPHGGVYIIEDMETSVNQELYPQYADFPISAYDVLSRIARVVASKNASDDSPYHEMINKIGMETELISIMKGSCVLIKL